MSDTDKEYASSADEGYESEGSTYVSEAGSDDESEYESDASSISIEPKSSSGKIKKGMTSKLGFTDKICKFGDKSCRNKNLAFLGISFLLVALIFYFVFKKMRPKLVMDGDDHVSQKKLIMYSLLFGLLGPVIYFSYTVVTM